MDTSPGVAAPDKDSKLSLPPCKHLRMWTYDRILNTQVLEERGRKRPTRPFLNVNKVSAFAWLKIA